MKLIIEDEEGRKTVVPVAQEGVSIGRQEDNTVRLSERNVSRHHAMLLRQNGAVVIEDLNSFNGVRVNGDRIQGRSTVQEGDLIQIGDYDLAIEREGESTPTRPTLPELGAVSSGELPALTAPEASPSPPNEPRPRFESTAVIKTQFGTPVQTAGEAVPLSAGEKPRLVLLNTRQAGREFLIEKSQLVLGREGPGVDFAIDHRSVSKAHARLARDGTGRWRITDLRSANGLKVNGESYGDAPVAGGDSIHLGHVELRWVGPGERFSFSDVLAQRARRQRLQWAGGAAVVLVLILGALAAALWHRSPTGEASEPPPGAEQRAAAALPTAPAAPAPPVAAPAPAPVAIAAPSVAAPPPPAPAPEDATAVADAARAQEAVGATRGLVRARKWDKADEKLKEAEAIDADDSTVQRLRKEIDAARDREAARAGGKAKRKLSAVAGPDSQRDSNEPSVGSSAASRGDRRIKAQATYEDAIQEIGTGDYVGAIAKLERALDLDATLADAHKGLGICYAHLREPDKGAFHYEQYLKLKPAAHDAEDVKKMLRDYYKSRGAE